jgi:hypothetical protein
MLPGTPFTLDNAVAIVNPAFSSMKIILTAWIGSRKCRQGGICDSFLFTVESMKEADFKNGESSLPVKLNREQIAVRGASYLSAHLLPEHEELQVWVVLTGAVSRFAIWLWRIFAFSK